MQEKTACDDLVEGKKSLPLILFVNERGIDASEKQKRHSFVLECMDAAATGGASVPNVNALIKQLEISGSLDMAKKIGNDMLATGKHIFVEENVIFEDFFSVMLLS
ncbi:MAG: hypothetical protein Ta2B_24970 [Termitinemataceae bacterium]|nr:MAG: hypothetical protein Ta2B_24970 [Termitinemataceae bacterium]